MGKSDCWNHCFMGKRADSFSDERSPRRAPVTAEAVGEFLFNFVMPPQLFERARIVGHAGRSLSGNSLA
jgi:hypothetical protein